MDKAVDDLLVLRTESFAFKYILAYIKQQTISKMDILYRKDTCSMQLWNLEEVEETVSSLSFKNAYRAISTNTPVMKQSQDCETCQKFGFNKVLLILSVK